MSARHIGSIAADGVQIVILDNPEIYSEYVPYSYVKDMKQFIDMVNIIDLINLCVSYTNIDNRSIQYYTEFAVDIEEKGRFKKSKKDIRNQINVMRKSLEKLPQKVVKNGY